MNTPPVNAYPIYPTPAGCQLVQDGLDLLEMLLEDILRLGFNANRNHDKLAKLIASYIPRLIDSQMPLLAHRIDLTSYYANTWRLNNNYYELLFRLATTHFLVKQAQNYANLDLNWQGEVRYWLGTATPCEALHGPSVEDCFLILGKTRNRMYVSQVIHYQYIVLGCHSQRLFLIDEFLGTNDECRLTCRNFYTGTLCLYPGVTPLARGLFKPQQDLTDAQVLSLLSSNSAQLSNSAQSSRSRFDKDDDDKDDDDDELGLDMLSAPLPSEFLSPKLLPKDFAITKASPQEQKVLKARYKQAKKEIEASHAALLPVDLKLPVFANLHELQKASAQCFAQNPLITDFYAFVDKVKVCFKPHFTQAQKPNRNHHDDPWGAPAALKFRWRLVDEQGYSLQDDVREFEGEFQQLKLVNLGLDQAHTVLVRMDTTHNDSVYLKGLILDGVFYGL